MSEDLLKSLAASKTTARRLTKGLSSRELASIIENLQTAFDVAKKQEAEKTARKKAADLRKLKSMIETLGISATDIRKLADAKTRRKVKAKKAGASRKITSKKRKKIAPKYRIKVGRKLYKWTGRGRMPLAFKDFVEQGGSLEKCLIKK